VFSIKYLFINILLLTSLIPLNAGEGELAEEDCYKKRLHNAAIKDDSGTLDFLLGSGDCFVDELEPLSNDTALHKAAYYGCLNAALILLSNGAENCYNNFLYTPVHLAILKNQKALFALLFNICHDEEEFYASCTKQGLSLENLAEKNDTTVEKFAKEGLEELQKRTGNLEKILIKAKETRKNSQKIKLDELQAFQAMLKNSELPRITEKLEQLECEQCTIEVVYEEEKSKHEKAPLKIVEIFLAPGNCDIS
jgi:hypothetical protein